MHEHEKPLSELPKSEAQFHKEASAMAERFGWKETPEMAQVKEQILGLALPQSSDEAFGDAEVNELIGQYIDLVHEVMSGNTVHEDIAQQLGMALLFKELRWLNEAEESLYTAIDLSRQLVPPKFVGYEQIEEEILSLLQQMVKDYPKH
jgi:hypothetical protein